MLVELYPEKYLQVNFKKEMPKGYIQAEKSEAARINIQKLKNLGWRQKYSIREGFARTIESFYNIN